MDSGESLFSGTSLLIQSVNNLASKAAMSLSHLLLLQLGLLQSIKNLASKLFLN